MKNGEWIEVTEYLKSSECPYLNGIDGIFFTVFLKYINPKRMTKIIVKQSF